MSVEPSTILFINVSKALATKNANEELVLPNMKLLRNLFAITSAKNRYLAEKLSHMSKRSTREKLLSYLSALSKHLGTAEFDLPYNRQQLADYLSVDRSALSGELSKMRKDGLIEFHKNHFELRLS